MNPAMTPLDLARYRFARGDNPRRVWIRSRAAALERAINACAAEKEALECTDLREPDSWREWVIRWRALSDELADLRSEREAWQGEFPWLDVPPNGRSRARGRPPLVAR
jgi:hypothetical protein